MVGMIATISLSSSCTKDMLELEPVLPVDLCDTINVSYTDDILPMVQSKCTDCHYSGSGIGDFNTYVDLKTKVDEGKVYNRVFVLGDMPPVGQAAPDSCEKVLLKAWINLGAPEN